MKILNNGRPTGSRIGKKGARRVSMGLEIKAVQKIRAIDSQRG
jgi:hypothetical protein